MTTVCFEFPTKHPSEVEYISGLIESYATDTFHAVLTVDGEIGEKLAKDYDGCANGRVTVRCVDPGTPLSMTKLRLEAAKIAAEQDFDYGILSDGDIVYSEKAFDFILETISKLPSVPPHQGLFCNMRGFFGSSGPGDAVLIPRQLPLGTNNGTIYNRAARNRLLADPPPALPGGCEDPMICSWMVLVNNAIPFRRFKAPIRHPKKSTEYYGASPIHNKAQNAENNFPLMKDLWESIVPTSKGKRQWAGVPDNMDQSGMVTDEGVWSPYHPESEKFVRGRFQEGHPLWPVLQKHINW